MPTTGHTRKAARPRLLPTVTAALRLRCPRCGVGEMFEGFFRMHAECAFCRLRFEREQGFFVGAIYVNYAVTVLIAMPGFFLLDRYGATLTQQLIFWGAFVVIFPLAFFRHSRSLWLAVSHLLDPGDDRWLKSLPKQGAR
ncbi:MAG TPA: DUF983 domain-containing protein [Candidatus Binatia bacterium]|nr:DUF983 domain-containing protein [Candidatus Binatia bacterium]